MAQTSQDLQTSEKLSQIDRILDDLAAQAEGGSNRDQFFSNVLQHINGVLEASASGLLQEGIQAADLIAVAGSESNCRQVIKTISSEHPNWFEQVSGQQEVIVASPGGVKTALAQAASPNSSLVFLVVFDETLDESQTAVIQSFLAAIGEIVQDFEANRAIQEVDRTRKLYEQLHRFSVGLSESLDLRETALTTANFCQQLFQAKRVVVVHAKKGCKVSAVSGVEKFNTHSTDLRFFRAIVRQVHRKLPDQVFFSSDDSRVKNRFRAEMEAYAKETEELIVLPLRSDASSKKASFYLTVEIPGKRLERSQFLERARLVGTQVRNALHNADKYSSLPFRRILEASRSLFGTTGGLMRIALLLIFLAAIAMLFVIKRPLTVYADGELVPANQKIIHAPEEGLLQQVLVSDGSSVKRGQKIIQIRSLQIETDLKTEKGELETLKKQKESVELALSAVEVNDSPESQVEAIKLTGEVKAIDGAMETVQKKITLLEKRKESLTILSPTDGLVVAWELDSRLKDRPVKKGEALFKIIQPDKDWYADVKVNTLDAEFLFNGNRFNEHNDCKLGIATRPTELYSAEFHRLSDAAESDPISNQNTMKLRLLIQDPSIEEFSSGASVRARFECGEVTLFYSWFYRAVRKIQYAYF